MNHDTLQQYIEGNASQQQKEEVAKWLDADEKNMQEFLLLRNMYDATLWSEEDIFSHEIIKSNENKKKNKKRRIALEFLKVAAVFLVALACYHLLLYPNITNSNVTLQTVYAPEGQRAEVILSDGTKVWLNAKSSLDFPDQFADSERIVELNGEAYFDVAHDEAKKFVVRTETYQVKVHGTEFNVRAYKDNDHFETALIEGSVEVISNSTNQSIMLSPNSKVYAENNELVLTDIGTLDQFLWKDGILHFENLEVKDIFEKLELYYDVKIEVKNKEILTHRYTGKFWTKDGFEHILRVLQLRHNFNYAKNNVNNKNNVVIY